MFNLLLSPATLSGHKAHIFATSPEQVDMVMGRIQQDAEWCGWGVKVATEAFFAAVDAEHPQYGKGVTVYFPSRDSWESDLEYLALLMAGYPFAGEITGDDMVSDNVGHRFEFHSDPGYDIDPADVHSWYVAAF